MAETAHDTEPLVKRLRCHVLEPIRTAERAVESEREEVLTERRAFEAFADQVAEIEPVAPREPATTPHQAVAERDASRLERVRRAFQETVMDVPHYDEVYGEPLAVHAAEELSTALAAGFQAGTGTTFTRAYKRMLCEAIAIAIGNRERFCATLDTERASLETSREALTDQLDPLDGPRIPAWYTTDFEENLAELAETRQETMQSRTQVGRIDGHDLCGYLYDEPQWTYPVLTAVGRLRSAVDYRSERNRPVAHVDSHE